MIRLLIELCKFAIACTGPAAVAHYIYLSKKYFTHGVEVSDSIHTVLIASHGNYKYITQEQNQSLRFSLGVAVVALVIFFAMVILRIRRKS